MLEAIVLVYNTRMTLDQQPPTHVSSPADRHFSCLCCCTGFVLGLLIRKSSLVVCISRGSSKTRFEEATAVIGRQRLQGWLSLLCEGGHSWRSLAHSGPVQGLLVCFLKSQFPFLKSAFCHSCMSKPSNSIPW